MRAGHDEVWRAAMARGASGDAARRSSVGDDACLLRDPDLRDAVEACPLHRLGEGGVGSDRRCPGEGGEVVDADDRVGVCDRAADAVAGGAVLAACCSGSWTGGRLGAWRG